MVFFNDQVLPRANHRLRTLQQDIARKKPTFALKSRSINEVSPGKLYLQADYVDQSTSRLKVVTIYDLSRSGSPADDLRRQRQHGARRRRSAADALQRRNAGSPEERHHPAPAAVLRRGSDSSPRQSRTRSPNATARTRTRAIARCRSARCSASSRARARLRGREVLARARARIGDPRVDDGSERLGAADRRRRCRRRQGCRRRARRRSTRSCRRDSPPKASTSIGAVYCRVARQGRQGESEGAAGRENGGRRDASAATPSARRTQCAAEQQQQATPAQATAGDTAEAARGLGARMRRSSDHHGRISAACARSDTASDAAPASARFQRPRCRHRRRSATAPRAPPRQPWFLRIGLVSSAGSASMRGRRSKRRAAACSRTARR